MNIDDKNWKEVRRRTLVPLSVIDSTQNHKQIASMLRLSLDQVGFCACRSYCQEADWAYGMVVPVIIAPMGERQFDYVGDTASSMSNQA